MCETSKTPQPERTARCSCLTPSYWTGISQPAKGTRRAPAATWRSCSGVRLRAVPDAADIGQVTVPAGSFVRMGRAMDAPPPPLVTPARVHAAAAYASHRHGKVAFCVRELGQPPVGMHRTAAFQSASVVKAMLLVAALRHARDRPLALAERAALGPMIRLSENGAAEATFKLVGTRGLRGVARVAGMRRFRVQEGRLFEARVTASDQARLFLGLDALVPRRHRRYARALLRGVVVQQRWGIP